MDIKITRSYMAYQSAVSSGKHMEKSAPAAEGRKLRSDAVCLSSDGVKRQEASTFASALGKTMSMDASPDRIAELKKQVQDGTYEVSAEQIAKRLLSGL